MSAPAGRFAGRTALITGASRGFGRAAAEALGREGAQIVAVARTVGGLEELDDAVTAAGAPPAVLVPLDLTDGDGVDRLGAALFERFGALDLAVLAAAEGAKLTLAAHLEPKTLERLAAVNLIATHRLIRSIDPLLRAAPAGRLVYVADDKRARSLWAGYAATKAAAAALVEAYARETPSVRATLYAPPAMPTALRARTHPGEDKAGLTRPEAAAAALLDELARDQGPGGAAEAC